MEAVRDYVAERLEQGVKPADPVFRGNYSATRKFLRRLGARALKRTVHYHLLRHSSSTYYASRLNRQELCYRYGWRFSSNMPDVYISRAGMETKQLDEKFAQTELNALRVELADLKQSTKIKDERLKQLEQGMETLRQNWAVVAKALKLDHSEATFEAALARKARLGGGFGVQPGNT